MTEEEKKAIEYLENRLDILHNNTQWATENSIKVVLNLIDKQQKEIEELKDIKDMVQVLFDNNLPKERLILITNDHLKNTGFKYLLDNYISKDKVKDIIKCLDHEPYTAFDAYGELLYDTEIDIKQKLEKLLEEK